MENHYFTFGNGQPNAGKYVVIRSDSPDEAREEMFRRFGSKWSFQYTEKEWHAEGRPLHEKWGWEQMKKE